MSASWSKMSNNLFLKLLRSGQCFPIMASSIIVATKLLLCQVEEFCAVFYTISVKNDTEEQCHIGKDNAALVKFQATASGVKTNVSS